MVQYCSPDKFKTPTHCNVLYMTMKEMLPGLYCNLVILKKTGSHKEKITAKYRLILKHH